MRFLKVEIWSFLVLLAGLALLPGCSDEGVTPPPPSDQPVSFSTDIQPIFDARCVVCHQPGGQAFFLSLLVGESYDNLVNADSFIYTDPQATRVVPVDPDVSVLYNKVADTGQYGGIMPQPPSTPLAPAQIELIRLWIVQGALEN